MLKPTNQLVALCGSVCKLWAVANLHFMAAYANEGWGLNLISVKCLLIMARPYTGNSTLPIRDITQTKILKIIIFQQLKCAQLKM